MNDATDNSVTPYFYRHQIRSVILQFMQVFAWLHVNHSADPAAPEYVSVPVHYGLKDRVAAAIAAGNTQNALLRFPTIAVYMSGMELDYSSLKGYGVPQVTRDLPYGGVFPDDVQAIVHEQLTPMILRFSVSVMATNIDDSYQIVEQVMALFSRNFQVQLQTSDSHIQPNRIFSVEWEGISPESQYPPGQERRQVVHDLAFRVKVYFSADSTAMNSLIKSIRLRLAALDSIDILDEALVDIDGYMFNDMELINLKE